MQSRPLSPSTPGKTRKKLPLHEKVEVRSVEEGFLGSWHTGTIIGYENSARIVRYDHLLNDEGSYNLTERVEVSPIVDCVSSGESVLPDNYRGLIRPLPTSDVRGLRYLHYGQCVELSYDDAWWEGVVLDHEEGCEQRRIFFPDMGDEMVARIDMLRLSKDWDEVTEEWKPRGKWLFLDLIEELEKDWPLPVSVKQIWYEVRMKNGFEKLKDWTTSGRYIWRELMLQVLFDNIRITVKQLFIELNSSWDLEELGQSLLEFSEPALDVVLKTEGLFHSSPAVVPFEATFRYDNEGILPTDLKSRHILEHNDQAPISTMLTDEQAVSISNFALPIISHNPDEDSLIASNTYKEATDMSRKLPHMETSISTQKSRPDWKPFLPEMISGAEFCPRAIDECIKIYSLKRRPSHKLRLNAKKHLLHLGWKIEYIVDKAILRLRYFSPDGELFDSLPKVCMKFDRVSQELGSGSPMLMSPKIGRKSSVHLREETHSPILAGKSRASSKLSKLCTHDSLVIEPQYCPEAVRDYLLCQTGKKFHCGDLNMEAKLRFLNAKKHLSAIGWSFYYHMKGGKKEMRYIAPSGSLFYSLLSACKFCIEVSALTSSELSPTIHNSNLQLLAVESREKFRLANEKPLNLSIESYDISLSKGLVPLVEGESYKTRISRKKRKHDKSHSIQSSQFPKRGRKSNGSMKSRRSVNADSSTTVRLSSKRVRDKIASASQQSPRTVLSWLIDNNVVLPRARVYYYNKNNSPPLAEGRIAREGIKCGCCGVIFTLCKFEAHVGNTNLRPSAHIFLEDGRSLLECQLQLKRHKSNKVLRSESREIKGRLCNKTNDYICSICHYGGELVLCDQCPSSFHTQCLGLKEVPEGDWFCRSCCCRICGQSRFDEINGRVVDFSVLTCGQCEHRYHVECIKTKGIIKRYHEGYWFCGDTCEQIFCGLREILGKPLPLGTENLTWTLMKYMKSESHNRDASDDECLVEHYSKLSVALSVMHECFEPVKEPGTRRDLVEDVIFSRWSELHRLNFQGFYTVLLEKNDELISAATVRIYGKRVAEVPLVATRFQYRRLGMCRILMDELEKKLIELGVERLVLPAVPSVLNTWTTSFGFSTMDESERFKFLDYTFLDFQGTVFCQKALTSKADSVGLLTGAQAKSYDHVNKNGSIQLDGNNTASEDFHGEVVEEIDILEKRSTCCIPAVTDNENDRCSTAIVVDQSIAPNCSPLHTKILLECHFGLNDIKQAENKNEGVLKCYKRRKFFQ
ncbi:hypothetical protein OROHE_007166 [Orobanche hederae]